MGFSIGFGVGPLRWSKRLGGKRRARPARGTSLDLTQQELQQAVAEVWSREGVRKQHTFQWLMAGFFALVFALTGYGIPISLVILWWTRRKHAQRWEQVADRERAESARRTAAEQRAAAQHMTDQDREWLARHDGRR